MTAPTPEHAVALRQMIRIVCTCGWTGRSEYLLGWGYESAAEKFAKHLRSDR